MMEWQEKIMEGLSRYDRDGISNLLPMFPKVEIKLIEGETPPKFFIPFCIKVGKLWIKERISEKGFAEMMAQRFLGDFYYRGGRVP